LYLFVCSLYQEQLKSQRSAVDAYKRKTAELSSKAQRLIALQEQSAPLRDGGGLASRHYNNNDNAGADVLSKEHQAKIRPLLARQGAIIRKNMQLVRELDAIAAPLTGVTMIGDDDAETRKAVAYHADNGNMHRDDGHNGHNGHNGGSGGFEGVGDNLNDAMTAPNPLDVSAIEADMNDGLMSM
jgi:hypothetical protein